MADEIQIRKLKARDVKTLAKMLAKMDTASISKLQKLVQSPKGKLAETVMFEVGFSIIQTIATVTDDIWAWLADLAGMSVEEFDTSDFDAPEQVVRQLINGGQFQSFFGLVSKTAGKKVDSTTSSNPDTDGVTEK
jgi:hypothetical protein